MAPSITLHTLPPSHPCMTVREALKLKGLEFEEVALPLTGGHRETMAEVYGEGNTTVPGAVIDGEPVHGSRAIIARLDALAPDPPLLTDDAVREAERWGDDVLQDLGRRLPWAALHFRPEAMGVLGGAGPLDPAGTDFAIKMARASWRYHGVTAQRLHDDLQGLPEKLDHVDALVADGVLLGDAPNAADLQIGATIKVLLLVGDLHPLLRDRPAEEVATRWFDPNPGAIPAGAYPAGWVPAR